jgi:hypothetical protein
VDLSVLVLVRSHFGAKIGLLAGLPESAPPEKGNLIFEALNLSHQLVLPILNRSFQLTLKLTVKPKALDEDAFRTELPWIYRGV